MSTNRSVQAAQRRRAGPPEPQQRKQNPVTSVNSAQMFASQVRNGNGPNIPNGKIAGQQAALAQKEMMKQQFEERQSQSAGGIPSINKMTVAQAITLITLRLGKIETSIQNLSLGTSLDTNVSFDKELVHSIMERLDNLERNLGNNNNSSNTELLTIRQNVEKNIVPVLTQTRGSVANLVKDNGVLKKQVSDLKEELDATKNLVIQLQNSLVFEQEEQSVEQQLEENTTEEIEVENPLSLKELVEQEINIEM